MGTMGKCPWRPRKVGARKRLAQRKTLEHETTRTDISFSRSFLILFESSVVLSNCYVSWRILIGGPFFLGWFSWVELHQHTKTTLTLCFVSFLHKHISRYEKYFLRLRIIIQRISSRQLESKSSIFSYCIFATEIVIYTAIGGRKNPFRNTLYTTFHATTLQKLKFLYAN